LIEYIKKKYKYFIYWSGALFWIEIADEDQIDIKEMKKFILEIEGYMTIIKKSENFSFIESVFTINENRLFISKKIKESFDPKKIFNPGKMYREI